MRAGNRIGRLALVGTLAVSAAAALACVDRNPSAPSVTPDPAADVFAGLMTVRYSVPGREPVALRAPLRLTQDGHSALGEATEVDPRTVGPTFERGVPATAGARPVVPHGRVFHSKFTDRDGHKIHVAQVFEPGNTDRPPMAIYTFRDGIVQSAIFVRHERVGGRWRTTGMTTMLLDSAANIRTRVDATLDANGGLALRSVNGKNVLAGLASGLRSLSLNAAHLVLPDVAQAQVDVCTAQKAAFLAAGFTLTAAGLELGNDTGECILGNVVACAKVPSDVLRFAAAMALYVAAASAYYACMSPTSAGNQSGSTTGIKRDDEDAGVDQWLDGELYHCNSDGTGCVQAA
jgi:hypothetical protein